MRLTKDFYRMPAADAARELLGKTLCRRTYGIVVTDYGKTPRIGIDYAEKEDCERLLRCALKDMKKTVIGETL